MFRSIDELGRLVIPKEYRKTMNIISGDLLKLELINNSDSSISLVISKEDKMKLCSSCGSFCRCKDNFCSSCGLDFSKL
ncbi:MAG: AbrB/MazE/SpoVT family DNA-binding domain-containing protein [Bacilli bacterium]